MTFAARRCLCLAVLIAGTLRAASAADDLPLPFRLVRDQDVVGLRRLLDSGLSPNTTLEGFSLLMHACEPWVNNPTLELLLDRGARIEARDRKGMTGLMHAASSFNPEAVESLIAHGANLNARDRKGWTALHWCVNWTQYDLFISGMEELYGQVAERVIRAGADPNAADRTGRTPLMWAAGRRHQQTFRALLMGGADMRRRDWDGRTALTWCAPWGRDDPYVKELLAAGSPVALIDALLLQDRDLARRLLAEGSRVSGRGPEGDTPLMRAAGLGDLDLVKLLLDRGASVRERSDDGRSVVMGALGGRWRSAIPSGSRIWMEAGPQGGRGPLIELLVSKGAPLNPRTRDGDTALHSAIELRRPEIAKLLLRCGANPNTRASSFDGSPLKLSVRTGQLDLVDELLRAGADPRKDGSLVAAAAKTPPNIPLIRRLIDAGSDVNDGEMPPLNEAARAGNIELMQLLLARGARAEPRSRYTPLVSAAAARSREAVELLLRAGARVNRYDGRGHTPLTIGAQVGSAGAVAALLAAGADVSLRTRPGVYYHLLRRHGHGEEFVPKTALQLARVGGHGEVAGMLVGAGARE